MSFRKRTVARIGAGAVGLLAAGALATPAFASTATDLELTVAGTKLASGADWKIGFAKIANKGEGTPTALKVTADLSALDLNKIIAVPDGEDCDMVGLKIVCVVPEADIPGPGETLDYPVVVLRDPKVSGPYTGKVTFSISSPDDTTPDNNKQTVEVAISDQSGVDLGVEVPDVKDKLATPFEKPGTPLNPGDTTVVMGWVFNWGDMIAKGVKVTVQLPEHVTFTETEEECEYSEDNRKAVCAYESVELLPTSESDSDEFVAGFWWPIKVSEDAPKHVTLRDGSWTVEALAQVAPGRQLKAMAPSKLPKNVTMASAKELGVNEVDASDNVDSFAVVLAKADGGSGGGLPVTGAEAGLIGGVGLAVVAVGGVLFLMARRRKVVLVTPEDEKPTV